MGKKSNIQRFHSHAGILKKKKQTQSTIRGKRSNSSNPTTAQPPSLLLKPLCQLICPEGDLNQGERVDARACVWRQHDKLCGTAPTSTWSCLLKPRLLCPTLKRKKTSNWRLSVSRHVVKPQTCAGQRHRITNRED